jgi:hypothetical protein
LKLGDFTDLGRAIHRLLEGQAFDRFEFLRDVLNRLRQAAGQEVNQEKLSDGQRNDDENDLLVRRLELPNEVARRRDDDGFPRACEALRETSKRGAQLLAGTKP